MSIIKSFSVGNGDLFYINHDTDSFTIIDCNLQDDNKKVIMDEICKIGKSKGIMRFISTHPDEDHFRGIEYFAERFPIYNFYCVENRATKSEETTSFKQYCKLRDSEQAFHIYRSCSRKWLNDSDNTRSSAGINILWPILTNEQFKAQLKIAQDGGNANNISPIIQYSLERGVSVLWFGDLESDFMESIKDQIFLPKADVIFAPHHGRSSGKLPHKWLNEISPKLIVIGEADSSMLDYYRGYNCITQNSARDIVFVCKTGRVHVYVSSNTYSVEFLNDEGEKNNLIGFYIGSFNTREQ